MKIKELLKTVKERKREDKRRSLGRIRDKELKSKGSLGSKGSIRVKEV